MPPILSRQALVKPLERARPRRPSDRFTAPPRRHGRLKIMLGTMFGTLWSTLLLPFRILFGAIELFGRLAALALGFTLMVLGVAISAGPTIALGIPLFLVGLLITIRAIE